MHNIHPLSSVLSASEFQKGRFVQTRFSSRITAGQASRLPRDCVWHFPAGDYIIVNHNGGYDDEEGIRNVLRYMQDYLTDAHYEVSSDGYTVDEMGHIASNCFENFVMQICFPVRKI